MHAVRNIRLCTKDCLCLYVCPTGATDTETGQIDAETCLSGCRACVDACPSHAIALVPEEYPAQQEKHDEVCTSLRKLSQSKAKQEQIAKSIAASADNPIARQLATAVAMSNRVMAEDLLREAGFMLPQSQNAIDFLRSLLTEPQPDDFPEETVKKLLAILDPNGQAVTQLEARAYRCPVCGYVHEGPMPDDFACPICGQPGSVFEPIH